MVYKLKGKEIIHYCFFINYRNKAQDVLRSQYSVFMMQLSC